MAAATLAVLLKCQDFRSVLNIARIHLICNVIEDGSTLVMHLAISVTGAVLFAICSDIYLRMCVDSLIGTWIIFNIAFIAMIYLIYMEMKDGLSLVVSNRRSRGLPGHNLFYQSGNLSSYFGLRIILGMVPGATLLMICSDIFAKGWMDSVSDM